MLPAQNFGANANKILLAVTIRLWRIYISMPKTKQQKQETIKTLTDGINRAKGVVFANFQGLTVADSENLRGQCRKENIKVVATKKTLMKRVLDELGLKEADPRSFSGGIAVFIGADEVSPAKIVNNFAKEHEIVTLYGGILEGKFINAAAVKNLAGLPGRMELLSKLVGSINAPVHGLVSVLAGNLRGLVSVLNNIKESKA